MRNWLKKSALGLSFFLTLSSSSILHASPPSLNDFAYIAKLGNAKTSLRQIDLPVEVYTKMFRQDYGDLRIFSADGQAVPHQFSHLETVSSTKLSNLIFYPFNREQANIEGNINIEINQSTGKQRLKINQSLPKKNNNSSEYQYIIENSESPKLRKTSQKSISSLCKLKLYWSQSERSLILGLKLESSDNLQQWRSLSRKLNVSRLNYGDSQLVRDEVEFTCTSEPYLRLTWLNQESIATDAAVRLTSIQGFFTQNNAQQSQWSNFAKPKYNDDGHWLFQSNVVAPLVKMEFKAPQNGLLYKGKLFSRNGNDKKWRYRDKITQYRLNLGDSELQSNPFSLGKINDRYWKFEPSIETKFTESQLPEIRGAWRSNKLLFIAQGSEPFQLAFGNPHILPAKNSDLNSLIQSLQQTGSAVDTVLLTEIVNGKKSFSRDGKTNWKKIALWLVLLLGTMLMAYMAYRLFQQMSDNRATEDKSKK